MGPDDRMWQILDEIRERLARIEEQGKSWAANTKDHESRLRVLEDRAGRATRMLAIFAAIGTAIGSFIGWIVKH